MDTNGYSSAVSDPVLDLLVRPRSPLVSDNWPANIPGLESPFIAPAAPKTTPKPEDSSVDFGNFATPSLPVSSSRPSPARRVASSPSTRNQQEEFGILGGKSPSGASPMRIHHHHHHRPTTPQTSNEDGSRNQLKVKIKGPFRDAKYSPSLSFTSTSLMDPIQSVTSFSATSSIAAEPMSSLIFSASSAPSPAVSAPLATTLPSLSSEMMLTTPTSASQQTSMLPPLSSLLASEPQQNNSVSTLRRMRKKELIRQYCNQEDPVAPFPASSGAGSNAASVFSAGNSFQNPFSSSSMFSASGYSSTTTTSAGNCNQSKNNRFQ